jgi:hypothetical protein
MELKLQPQQADCHWVDPGQSGIYASPSATFSMLALITCVTTNIPMKALFRAWWTFINTVAKPAYNKYAKTPLPFQIAKMWANLKVHSNMCYRRRNVNYLQTIFEFSGCQCSCGTALLLDVMESIDPKIQLTTVEAPSHVAVLVYDENKVPWIVETTQVSITKYDPTTNVGKWTVNPQEYNEILHAENWLRIFTEPYTTTKNEIALWNTMCHLHRLFELMPVKFDTLAPRIFRCFAGYAHAVVNQSAQKEVVFQTDFETLVNELPKSSKDALKHSMKLLEYQSNIYKKTRKEGNVVECDKIGTPAEQKKFQAFQRYYLMAPNYKREDETEFVSQYDEVLRFVENIRSQYVLNSQKEYQKDILVATVQKLEDKKDFDRAIRDYLPALIIQKALKLKKECMQSKTCGDFPGESAVRLSAAMLLYNPRIFLLGASAYMKYIEHNKISPESLKATSNWVEHIFYLSLTLADVEDDFQYAVDDLKKLQIDKAIEEKKLPESQPVVQFIERTIQTLEHKIIHLNQLLVLLQNRDILHFLE